MTDATAKPPAAEGESPRPAAEPGELNCLRQQASELLEQLSLYLNAKADALKLQGRLALLRIELEIVGILAAVGVIVVAVALMFTGVAQGLAELFGGRLWLGNLCAGLLLLAVLGLAMAGWSHWWQKASRDRSVEKYERQKLQQQTKVGRRDE